MARKQELHWQPSEETRNHMMIEYYYVVKFLAHKLKKKLPPSVTYEDLVSIGVFGLMDAIRLFNPHQTRASFKTFANWRIYGSMLDYLRDNDTLSKTMRKWSETDKKITACLTDKLKRTPTNDELAEAHGIELKHYVHKKLIAQFDVISLEDLKSDSIDHLAIMEVIADHRAKNPEKELIRESYSVALREAQKTLTEQEKLCIYHTFYEGRSQIEIAEILQVTNSRVSQIYHKALDKIRKNISVTKDEIFIDV